MNRVGRWRELDQFHHPVAVNDLPRRGGDILAQTESAVIGQPHEHLALIGLDIGDQILQPLDQRLTLGGDGAFQRVGIGGQEIRGCHHVDDLAREIFQTLLFLGRHVVDLGHGLLDGLRVDHVLLLDEVEIWMRLPHRVGKAPVIGRVILGRLQLAAGKGLLRLKEMFDRAAPIFDLSLEQMRRVLHHPGPVGARSLGEHLLIRCVQGGIRRLAV